MKRKDTTKKQRHRRGGGNAVRKVAAPKPQQFEARPHQLECAKAVLKGLKADGRAQLEMFTGTGKTLTYALILQGLAKAPWARAESCVALTSSLYLVKQIFDVAKQHLPGYEVRAMCTADDVKNAQDDEEEDTVPRWLPGELLTTDDDLHTFLRQPGKRIVIMTYSSSFKLKKASVDVLIYDEAHRTTGREMKAKRQRGWSKTLSDKFIKAKYRIFGTATRKMRNPMKEWDEFLFSMDDEEQYGKLAYLYPFKQALADGNVVDYEINILQTRSRKILSVVSNDEDVETECETDVTGRLVAASELITKESKAKSFKFGLVFVNSQRRANRLQRLLGNKLPNGGVVHVVDCSMTQEDQDKAISDWRQKGGVLINVNMFCEGTDFPEVDALFLVDPRQSSVRII